MGTEHEPLPPIKVGQVWQLRDQKHMAKIDRVDLNTGEFWVKYGKSDGNWDPTPFNRPYSINEIADGAYADPGSEPGSDGSPTYDLTVLLYDPN